MAALTRVAFEVCAVDRVEIHVDPVNTASLGIPRKLGFAEGAPGDEIVFTLFADRLEGTPAAAARVEAYDAAGNRLL